MSWRKKRSSEKISEVHPEKRGETVVEMKGITKKFPGVLANDHVNFELRAGEIHGLLGENGAGKTTLMNVLYGLYKPDEGEIYIRGEKVNIDSPQTARGFGIGMVHQEPKLADQLSVIENIICGYPELGIILNPRKHMERIKNLQEEYGLKVDSNAKVYELDAGEKQIVEVLKALYHEAKILILDEPSSTMSLLEAEKLLYKLRKVVDRKNLAIVLITHKIPIALKFSDRITILRNGRLVSTVNPMEVNEESLSEMMVGEKYLLENKREKTKKTMKEEIILTVENLSASGSKKVQALNNISFTLQKGEILGIAGVRGNGQVELAETLVGLRKPTRGKIIFQGLDITNFSTKDRFKMGIGYIPAERTEGLIGEYSITKNIMLNCLLTNRFSNRGILDFNKAEKDAERLRSEFEIKVPNLDTKAKYLSGGNLQKLLLARILSCNPKLLIVDMPTKGLDVKATKYIHEKLIEAKENGTAILLISNDLSEIFLLSDRIAPLYDGKFVKIVQKEKTTVAEISKMMLAG